MLGGDGGERAPAGSRCGRACLVSLTGNRDEVQMKRKMKFSLGRDGDCLSPGLISWTKQSKCINRCISPLDCKLSLGKSRCHSSEPRR